MGLLFALTLFFIGVANGVIGMIAFTLYLGHKSLKKKQLEAPPKVSINDRIKRVKDIATEQLDLSNQSEGPQKNALDGKHKNGLIGRLKVLEEEKNEILKSILADGADPELTTVDQAGVVTQMKLSEYMTHMGISMEPKKKSPKEVKAERMGKFTVFNGGNDGGNTTH